MKRGLILLAFLLVGSITMSAQSHHKQIFGLTLGKKYSPQEVASSLNSQGFDVMTLPEYPNTVAIYDQTFGGFDWHIITFDASGNKRRNALQKVSFYHPEKTEQGMMSFRHQLVSRLITKYGEPFSREKTDSGVLYGWVGGRNTMITVWSSISEGSSEESEAFVALDYIDVRYYTGDAGFNEL